MDSQDRRSPLRIRPFPTPRLDVITRLEGPVPLALPGLAAPTVALAYVPDKAVLDPASFSRYLSSLARMSWNGAESLALAILDDINNEAVPRWARVRITTRTHGGLHHQVTVEDHQPRWRPTWVGAPVAE